jgi:hypothetical protein
LDAWLPKILITIGKETHHVILDLGSSVSVLSKELHELLELKNLEKCSIDLLIADDSTKNALGKINNFIVELHMNFVHVDFVIMDMEYYNIGNTFSKNNLSCYRFEGRECKVLFYSQVVHGILPKEEGDVTKAQAATCSPPILDQVNKSSYIAIKKTLYGRQPICFYFCFLH